MFANVHGNVIEYIMLLLSRYCQMQWIDLNVFGNSFKHKPKICFLCSSLFLTLFHRHRIVLIHTLSSACDTTIVLSQRIGPSQTGWVGVCVECNEVMSSGLRSP